jgi:hypothetical protein
LVADAVVVEPVSTPQFPANREKNREFCNFGGGFAHQMARKLKLNHFEAVGPNSLLIGTGNFWSMNREFRKRIGEFPVLKQLNRSERSVRSSAAVPQPEMMSALTQKTDMIRDNSPGFAPS